MKFKMLNKTQRITEINGVEYIIGLDFGSMGTSRYYYIESCGKVLSHGHSLRSAKEYLLNKVANKA